MQQNPDLTSLLGAADRKGFSLFRMVNHRRSADLIEQDAYSGIMRPLIPKVSGH